MKSTTDKDLILHYYGESSDPTGLERVIEGSAEVAERFDQIRRILDNIDELEVPNRAESYGSRIWQALEPKLDRGSWWRRKSSRTALPPWVLIGATACLLVVAFVAGRVSNRHQQSQVAVVVDNQDERDRALFLTVANHLERSEMLLLELINVETDGEINVGEERLRAGELKSQGRLYRQAAVRAGQQDLADILERIEVVLVELANGPDDVGPSDLEMLRRRVDDGDLLFRVRIVGSRLREDVDKSTPFPTDDKSVVDV